jgi:hypothetical protein
MKATRNLYFRNISELAGYFEITTRTIKNWIKNGKLRVTIVDGEYQVEWGDNEEAVFRKLLEKNRDRIYEAYTPKELTEYSEWHTLLDELCWLLKVCYTPEQMIKRKKFRTDVIFVRYIQAHKITLKKAQTVFRANQSHTPKTISDDLKRGWYNELAFVVPLKPSTLGLSFADIHINTDTSSMRLLSPHGK